MMRALVNFALPASLLLSAVPALAETKVAILPITAKTGMDEKAGELLTDVVTGEAGKRKDLKVVGSAELKTLVSLEQQKAILGCLDDSCLAEVGAALGVDLVVSGSVGKFGDSFVLNMVLMDMKSAKPLNRVTETLPSESALLKILPWAVATLLSAIPGGPPPPARPGEAGTSSAAGGQKQDGRAAVAGGDGKGEGGGATSSGGGSSLPRRLVGVGIAAAGGVGLLLGVVVGLASVGWLVGGRLAIPGLVTGFAKYGGFGIAGVADVLGILSVLVVGVGVVIAVLP